MPASSYTRATLRAAVQQEMNDTSGTYFTAAIVNGFINDAMGEWCERARSRRYNWQIDIVANTSVYSLTALAPRAIQINRASLPSNAGATDDIPLTVVTQVELDRDWPNWRSMDGSWPRVLVRDLQGPQSMRLIPTPDTAQAASVRSGTIILSATTGLLEDISGLTTVQATATYGITVDVQFLAGSLQLYGIAGSTDLSDDSTTVETACGASPDRQDALLWWVCARCCELSIPIAQKGKADGYWAKFAEQLGLAVAMEKQGFQNTPTNQPRGRFV